MSTAAQIEANRRNAAQSTGPVTGEGKAASSQNRFQHGFCGCFRVLPYEDADAYDTLVAALRDEHRPSTPTELILVERLAQHHWLAQRAMVFQGFLLEEGPVAPACQKDFALYLRYQTTNERAFSKCLRELQTLRAERRKEEIGFEQQKHIAAEEQRKKERHDTARVSSSTAPPASSPANPPVRESSAPLEAVFSSPHRHSVAELNVEPAMARSLEAA